MKFQLYINIINYFIVNKCRIFTPYIYTPPRTIQKILPKSFYKIKIFEKNVVFFLYF